MGKKGKGRPTMPKGDTKVFIPIGVQRKKIKMLGEDECKIISEDAIDAAYKTALNTHPVKK